MLVSKKYNLDEVPEIGCGVQVALEKSKTDRINFNASR